MRPDSHLREQRAAIIAACLWPILLAAVMLCDVGPYLGAMLRATA